jgi:hypothetical protein
MKTKKWAVFKKGAMQKICTYAAGIYVSRRHENPFEKTVLWCFIIKATTLFPGGI